MSTPRITFNHNWNGKLFCTCFTSLRLRNDKKYQNGTTFQIILNKPGKNPFNAGEAILCDVRHLYIHQINDFMAMIDTGYNREETVKMLQTMYKNIVADWNTQQLSLLLFRRIQVDKSIANAPKTITYKASTSKQA